MFFPRERARSDPINKDAKVQVKAILFDLDDTLYDYAGARDAALGEVNNRLARQKLDVKSFAHVYAASEPELFQDFVEGRMEKEAYRIQRFLQPLRALGLNDESLAARLNSTYMRTANEGGSLFPDVLPTVADLVQSGILVGVFTNGPSDGQRKKLDVTGLCHHLDYVFISEEVGCAKPNPKFAETACQTMGLAPHSVACIGDSFEMDYCCAREAGLVPILLDRRNAHKEFDGRRFGSLTSAVRFLRTA